jgi:hypothetical protein
MEAVGQLLACAEIYANAYRDHFDAPVGTDSELGQRGLAEILSGAETLLNGPLGRLDAASLARWIDRIRSEHGLEEE